MPTRLQKHKPTVLLNSCKTRPQPWQGAPRRVEQFGSTRTFVPGASPEVRPARRRSMSPLCVLADGGLRGGLGGSWPGRLPVRSGFVWQRLNRGCSLHAQRHGYPNSEYVSLTDLLYSMSLYDPNTSTKLVQSLRAYLS